MLTKKNKLTDTPTTDTENNPPPYAIAARIVIKHFRLYAKFLEIRAAKIWG